MDNTIDTLQIEIESSTTDAQRGLTKLKNSLQKLTEMSNAVANMNSDGISKLKEMAQGVESLANAGSNPGLSAAVSELRKLSKIDFSNLGAGSEKISEIADKVGEITNANPTSTITPPETSTETVPIAPSVDVEETKSKLSQLKEFAANIFSSIKTGATTVFGGVAKVIGGAFKGIVTVFQKLGSAAKSVFGAMKKLGSYIGGKLKGAVGGATKKFSGFIRSMVVSLCIGLFVSFCLRLQPHSRKERTMYISTVKLSAATLLPLWIGLHRASCTSKTLSVRWLLRSLTLSLLQSSM